jgi:hypothetical protein
MGAGLLAVWAVKKAISNRRSPRLKIVMSVSAFIASLLPIVTWIIATLPAIREYGFLYSGGLLSIVWSLAYSVIISSNIYYQLRR